MLSTGIWSLKCRESSKSFIRFYSSVGREVDSLIVITMAVHGSNQRWGEKANTFIDYHCLTDNVSYYWESLIYRLFYIYIYIYIDSKLI